jgi:nucleotide-binding universal stress UspA family protein
MSENCPSSHAIDAGGSVADRSIGGPSIGGAGCVVGSAAWPVARWGVRVQTGCMPSDLISPTGMAPGSGDETLSPLRRWRNDHGEQVADCREVLSGPVVVGYDGTPEASGVCVALRGGRAVTDVLCVVAREVGAGGVVVGARPRRGWRRLLARWDTAPVLARHLKVPVVPVPLSERKGGR